MGDIIATCGHSIRDEWDEWFSKDRSFEEESPMEVNTRHMDGPHRAISLRTMCKRCREIAKACGCLLETEEQKKEWLEYGIGNVW